MNIKDIKNNISKDFDLKKKLWIVLTWIGNEKIESEKWIIFTDNSLEDNINQLFDKYIKRNKNIKILVIDIIKNTKEIKTKEELQNIDILKEWIFIWDIKNDNWSFILPDTKWVDSLKKAISLIKKKVEFSSTKINLYKFTSKRYAYKI